MPCVGVAEGGVGWCHSKASTPVLEGHTHGGTSADRGRDTPRRDLSRCLSRKREGGGYITQVLLSQQTILSEIPVLLPSQSSPFLILSIFPFLNCSSLPWVDLPSPLTVLFNPCLPSHSWVSSSY